MSLIKSVVMGLSISLLLSGCQLKQPESKYVVENTTHKKTIEKEEVDFDLMEKAFSQELFGSDVYVYRMSERSIKIILNSDFSFGSGNAVISESAKYPLIKITKVINYFKGTTLVISGHTDSIGEINYNDKLSKARAMSVQNYLNSQGVLRSRTQVENYGELMPKCSNETKLGRSCNRRVELIVVQ